MTKLYKCEYCTLTYSNEITLVWCLHFFLGGGWFSKILRNTWGCYVKILTIPYRGGWVVWKRSKTPLRNIKMAPYMNHNIAFFHGKNPMFWFMFMLNITNLQRVKIATSFLKIKAVFQGFHIEIEGYDIWIDKIHLSFVTVILLQICLTVIILKICLLVINL